MLRSALVATHPCNPSLSLLLAAPASYSVTVFLKAIQLTQRGTKQAFSLTDKLLSIPTSGSFLSQMDRTLLVYQFFPLTYLFSL